MLLVWPVIRGVPMDEEEAQKLAIRANEKGWAAESVESRHRGGYHILLRAPDGKIERVLFATSDFDHLIGDY